MREGEPRVVDMGGGFHPWRRDVEWSPSREAPIAPLLDSLRFTAGKKNWGYPFRFGLFEIGPDDFGTIARAMEAGAFAGVRETAPA